MPPKWRGYGNERRACEAAVAAHRAEVERVSREAEWLRHAVDELTRLAPQAGEETSLAERRCRHDAGGKSRRRFANHARSRQRPAIPGAAARDGAAAPRAPRRASAGADRAGGEGDRCRAHGFGRGARASRSARCASAEYDPKELERIEERLFALRAAARKYNVPVDELNALARRYAGDLALIDAGAERLAALENEAQAAARAIARPRRSSRRSAASAALALDKAVNAELKPLKLDRARFSTEIAATDEGAGRHRPRRILGAHQSRHAAGTADEDRLRRRTRALPARAQGGAGRPRLGADADLRRDRYRRRRRCRRRDRRAAGAACLAACR